MRRALPAIVAAVALATTATARADDLPPSAVGILMGVRHGTSTVSQDIGFGYSLGLEAAWQPMAVGQRLGWSASWSLLWGWFGDQPAARITGNLHLLELDVAIRARFAPTPSPGRVLTLGIGGMLLRSNEPVPPDAKRSYFGPFAELGYEHLAWGTLTASFHLRLGPIATGPTILSGLLGFGFAL